MAAGTAGPRRHRTLVSVLLVIAVLTGFVGMFAVWVNRQALNTDNWTKTSEKLLERPAIQQALGAYLVDQLFTNVDVAGQIQQVLPPQAAALAGPAAAGLRQLADRAAPKLLARPAVQEAWRVSNRTAHKELLRIVNGGSAAVSTTNGEVVLNLHALIDQLAATAGLEKQVGSARSKLQGSAPQVRQVAQQKLGIQLPPTAGQLVVMRSDQLKTIQNVAHGIRGLAIVFTALPILLFALAVWLAQSWRRVALRTTGWCFAGLGLVVLLARRVVGNRVVDGLVASDSVKAAAHDAWSVGTSLLYDIAIAMLVYGIVLVVAASLAGPSRVAIGARRAVAPAFRERLGVVWGFAAVAFLLLLVWGPTPATHKPLGILLFAALLVLGVEVLRRQVGREFPDAHTGDTMERIRRWARGLRRPRAKPPPMAAGGS